MDQELFVKICGITDVDDALLAVALGADAVGFIFAPSKRQIAPQRARDIAARMPGETLTVGVFRNDAKERVVDVAHRAGLRAVQLHGDESPADTAWISERVPVVIKAFAAGSPAADRAREWGVRTILVDAPNPGSGEVFDWSLMESLPMDLDVLLAGGLNPDNVAAAVQRVQPWGVDVASGVESSPGRKDPTALRLFIQNAKAAASRPREAVAGIPDENAAGVGTPETPMYDWNQEND